MYLSLQKPSHHRQVHCITNQKQQGCASSLRHNSARDRVIDFGKYKGKMLGSLPSKYLKWVSKNLRARDFEEWAILADQVLVDPIYRDRIEWEFALNVLDGSARSSTEPADAQLHEISERFGWNYLDKVGWSKLDFDRLGTSKGGRILRLLQNPTDTSATEPNLPPPPATSISITSRSRRMERTREKLKMKHEAQQQHNNDTVDAAAADIEQVEHRNTVDAADIEQVEHRNTVDTVAADIEQVEHHYNNANPFPGRQALFRKAINHRAQS